MKLNKKLYSTALISAVLVLFLIFISSTASASITKTKLTGNGKGWDSPAIYGNKIVWTEEHSGSDIYLFDLSTKKKTQISKSGSASSPEIYDNRIVWQDGQNSISNIYMYDISTKKITQITNSGTAYYPSICGNIIVWNDDRSYYDSNQISIDPIYDVYAYDISTKKETKIAELSLSYAVYGNKIAILRSIFEGPNSGNDIYVYDLSTKKETQITTSGFNGAPVIYGNKIVWAHWNDNEGDSDIHMGDSDIHMGDSDIHMGDSDIYMYDLSTKKETQITTNKSDQYNPDIYGNNIVWMDNRNGNWDIYAFDLITHQQVHTLDNTFHDDPAVYGNTIIWADSSNEKSDIYIGTINYLPEAAFSASPTTGKQPLNVQFTDKSTDAYYRSWSFGDGSTSTAQNPTHKYDKAGKYTVTLTVKNAAGSNIAKKTNYITVK